MNVSESLSLFYKADWITFGVRKRLNLSPMIATILWYLVFNGTLLIIAIRDGIIFSPGSRVGF